MDKEILKEENKRLAERVNELSKQYVIILNERYSLEKENEILKIKIKMLEKQIEKGW